MSNHLRWAAVGCLSLMCVVAQSAEKGLSVSGDFVGGYGLSWQPSGAVVGVAGAKLNDSQHFVDNAQVKMRFGVTDKVTVHFNNSASMTGGTVAAASAPRGTGLNTINYLSARANLSGGRYNLTNTATYIENQCSDNVKFAFGHMAVPFAMEGMTDRYDMHTYYYSAAYGTAAGLGFNYDMALKVTLNDLLPGTWEIAVLDGRTNQTGYAPGAALRWGWTHKAADWSLTPTVSTVMNRWRGGPKDLGLSAGLNWKMAAMFANLEWVYTSTDPTFSSATKDWSLYLEPGYDFGAAVLSVKADMENQKVGTAAGQSDFHIGAAVSKTYADKMQVKLAYQHANVSGKLGAHSNDFRILFGTKW